MFWKRKKEKKDSIPVNICIGDAEVKNDDP